MTDIHILPLLNVTGGGDMLRTSGRAYKMTKSEVNTDGHRV